MPELGKGLKLRLDMSKPQQTAQVAGGASARRAEVQGGDGRGDETSPAAPSVNGQEAIVDEGLELDSPASEQRGRLRRGRLRVGSPRIQRAISISERKSSRINWRTLARAADVHSATGIGGGRSS